MIQVNENDKKITNFTFCLAGFGGNITNKGLQQSQYSMFLLSFFLFGGNPIVAQAQTSELMKIAEDGYYVVESVRGVTSPHPVA